ncbi:MAG: folK [Hydrocarboniphaga sp.]|uniref:2-amino-4-hydroxy-6- hydroxymethyldihydropteridine diphosphokinase n=1 Tax=Hydrocarboniphaga sp. TaxID=2033016 RepID=UPI00262F13D2|nr:2-amino-4-hydroxy-6-hydroxymethyldihydropteridine diphosphokinase [Hydrocarboniphaga sp.]MDB5968901.1 folK [Hydrocarboniphaga sp.]
MPQPAVVPTAYVGLGSNLDDPAQQIRDALQAIGRIAGLRLLAVSSLYRSPPMGPPEQPEYCNAVCAVECGIEPASLMSQLLEIERQAGRVRGGEHWGPRRIDLDLLHIEGVRSATAGLRLPHPGIARRNFVVAPLAEIAPLLEIPGVGRVAELAARIPRDDLSMWLT